MQKILIIGNGPLPQEKSNIHIAAGVRTNHFWTGLTRHFSSKKNGIDLRLVKIDLVSDFFDKAKLTDLDSQIYELNKNDKNLKKKLQAIYDFYKPDSVIAVNTFSSFLASSLNIEAALWADLNGWSMSEAQAQAYKIDSNDYLSHYWSMERAIIKRADKISVVSEIQKFAIWGELAALGRMNAETFGYDFVSTIQNATERLKKDNKNERLEKVPEDGFKLLWLGGYNTWVDEMTLFTGVEEAMRQDPSIYYISTGGGIKGLDSGTFQRFKEMVDKSDFKERFIFLGWIDSEDIPLLYNSVDAGLNVDRMCIETMTGARNRINEMMSFGVPVVTTLGSEISYDIAQRDAGIGVKSGDSDALSEGILKMRKDCDGFKKRALEYVDEFCNYDYTLKPLVTWLEEGPKRAPDYRAKVNMGKGGIFKSAFLYLRQNGVKSFLKKVWGKVF